MAPIRVWLSAAAGLLISFCGFAAGPDPAPFAVGTASASPGQKVTGILAVPAGSDAALDIPVAVVRGARPGPVLALVAGAHGTEYASIIAIERLIEKLDPAQISGTVILVPLINTPSFEQKVPHLNPVDGKSMNRFYPGQSGRDADGARPLPHHAADRRAVRLPDRLSRRGSRRETCGPTATG